MNRKSYIYHIGDSKNFTCSVLSTRDKDQIEFLLYHKRSARSCKIKNILVLPGYMTVKQEDYYMIRKKQVKNEFKFQSITQRNSGLWKINFNFNSHLDMYSCLY